MKFNDFSFSFQFNELLFLQQTEAYAVIEPRQNKADTNNNNNYPATSLKYVKEEGI